MSATPSEEGGNEATATAEPPPQHHQQQEQQQYHSASAEAAYRFAASSIGALIAESITLPTDVAKTRLQVQASALGQPRYTGLADCVTRIYREEGARALWKGIWPALIRQVCYSSLSLVLYEPVRNAIGSLKESVVVVGTGHDDDGQPSFVERLLAGGTAGKLVRLARFARANG